MASISGVNIKIGDVSENRQWDEEVVCAWTSSEGSGGVTFLQCADDSVYVLKASGSVVEETFATCLLNCLEIPTMKVRIINSPEQEWDDLKKAVKICIQEAKKNNDLGTSQRLSNMLAGPLDRAQLMIMSFIEGSPLEGFMRAGEFFHASPGKNEMEQTKRLRQLGMIAVADIFMNNSDRIPLPCWDNDGNAGNIMVDKYSGIWAIDSLVNTLDPTRETSRPFFERYCKRVEETLQGILQAQNEQDISKSTLFQNIRSFIYVNTGFQADTSDLFQVRQGMLQAIVKISHVADSKLIFQLHKHMADMFDYTWMDGWADGMARIKVEYFEHMSKLFGQFGSKILSTESKMRVERTESTSSPPLLYVPQTRNTGASPQKKGYVKTPKNQKIRTKRKHSAGNQNKLNTSTLKEQTVVRKVLNSNLLKNQKNKLHSVTQKSSPASAMASIIGDINSKFTPRTSENKATTANRPRINPFLNIGAQLQGAKRSLKVKEFQEKPSVLLLEAKENETKRTFDKSNQETVDMLKADQCINTILQGTKSQIWKLNKDDSMERVYKLLCELDPDLVVFDFDQTLTQPSKSMKGAVLRGGKNSASSIAKIQGMGVPCLIITANKPTVGSAQSVCEEVRGLGLGSMFNVEKPKLTNMNEIFQKWGDNRSLSNDLLTKKLMLLLSAYTPRKGKDLWRISASSIKYNKDGQPVSFALLQQRDDKFDFGTLGAPSAPQLVNTDGEEQRVVELQIAPCLAEYLRRTADIRKINETPLDCLFIEYDDSDSRCSWISEPIAANKITNEIIPNFCRSCEMSEREISILINGEAEEITFNDGIRLAVAGNLICSRYNKPDALQWYIHQKAPLAKKIVFFDDSTINVFNMFVTFRASKHEMHSVWFPPPENGHHEEIDPNLQYIYNFVDRASSLQKYTVRPVLRMKIKDSVNQGVNVMFKEKSVSDLQDIECEKRCVEVKNLNTVEGRVEVKVLIIQDSPCSVATGAEVVRKRIEEQNAFTGRNNVDFILLPEGFIAKEILKENENENVLAPYSKIAAEHSCYIICGTILEPHHHDGVSKYFTTAVVIGPDGERIGAYRKRAIHNVSVQESGTTVGVFDTIYGKIGILICLDIEDPNILNETLQHGPKLIFNPSHIPMPGKRKDFNPTQWQYMLDSMQKDLEHVCVKNNCVIFRCDQAFNGCGSSQVIGPFSTETIPSFGREYLCANITLDVSPEGDQTIVVPSELQNIPSNSRNRYNEWQNIGSRCRIKWIRVKELKAPVAMMYFISDSALAVITTDGVAFIVNPTTRETKQPTTEQKLLISASINHIKSQKDIGQNHFSELARINEGNSAVTLSEDGKLCLWQDNEIPILKHVFTSSWLLNSCTSSYVSGDFATAASAHGLIGIWSFSHNEINVPIEQLISFY